jgi:acetyltransferase-like isoleucine patch superfamily enzyme
MTKTYIPKPVTIEDDVWIGSNAIILPGVRIGKGSVIGAGSIVTSDIPPYALAYGTPAKVMKYRPQEVQR